MRYGGDDIGDSDDGNINGDRCVSAADDNENCDVSDMGDNVDDEVKVCMLIGMRG